MTNIWDNLPKPFFALAPMEAVTDVVFRQVVSRASRPDLYFSEFTNATGWYRAGDEAIGGRLVKTDKENPIIAQLWGADTEAMAKMSIHCRALGYDGIDINMGCPDKSAVRSGGGAGMILTPETANQIIASAKSSGLPISVKTRLGYSEVDEWRAWLTNLLLQDIKALTIHLRTKKEMSKVPAHFELIPEIKKLRDEIAPQTKLIINGDILDYSHGMELYHSYDVDGIMIGRGVFKNPYAFSKIDYKPTKHELIGLMMLQIELYDRYQPIMNRPFETLKRFFKIYINNFDGASEVRNKLMHTKSTDEVRQLMNELQLNS